MDSAAGFDAPSDEPPSELEPESVAFDASEPDAARLPLLDPLSRLSVR